MSIQPHVVVFDAYNFLHRCRSGFTSGEYSIVFNFFRGLRSDIEKHKPTRVIMVTEGSPKRQLVLSNDYKANRVIEPSSEQEKAHFDFLRQKDIILLMLQKSFPLTVMRHSGFEADDTIYNVVKNVSRAIPVTVVSTDTDFIQLLDEFDNVVVYNPVKKLAQEKTSYPYVAWKALRGDACDNIPGIPGIGDKKATKIVETQSTLNEFLNADEKRREQWVKNFEMIKFKEFTYDETMEVTSVVGIKDWFPVFKTFTQFGFKSMTNEKYWAKFVETFDPLF